MLRFTPKDVYRLLREVAETTASNPDEFMSLVETTLDDYIMTMHEEHTIPGQTDDDSPGTPMTVGQRKRVEFADEVSSIIDEENCRRAKQQQEAEEPQQPEWPTEVRDRTFRG